MPLDDDAIRSLSRPHPNLLLQYTLRSFSGLVLAPLVWLPLYFKYKTLRYAIREDGISASWGILFRREVHLSYKRIQDIHVSRSIIERYLGLATVELQTAAGSASAELAIEGMQHFDELRDFLYRRMRGHDEAVNAPGLAAGASHDDVVALLHTIREELTATRAAIEARP